jgi:hypothetical protein
LKEKTGFNLLLPGIINFSTKPAHILIVNTFCMRKCFLSPVIVCFIFFSANSQTSWRPFAALHISASSDLYYIGPSFSAGVNHVLGKKKKWVWAPEVQYFRQYSVYSGEGATHSWDKFVSVSIRSNFNYQTGKKSGKGFFIGGGIGFQKAKDECATITQNGTIKEENVHFDAIKFGTVMFTFNAGYTFPLKKNRSLQALISTIGPQTAKDYLGTYVEAISLISTGLRIVL